MAFFFYSSKIKKVKLKILICSFSIKDQKFGFEWMVSMQKFYFLSPNPNSFEKHVREIKLFYNKQKSFCKLAALFLTKKIISEMSQLKQF